MPTENLGLEVEVKIKELISYRNSMRYRMVNMPTSYKQVEEVEGIEARAKDLLAITNSLGFSYYGNKMEMAVKMVKIGATAVARNIILAGNAIGGLTELYSKNLYVDEVGQNKSAFICTFIHELSHALSGVPSEETTYTNQRLGTLVQKHEAIAYVTAWIIGEKWGMTELLKPTLHGLSIYSIEEPVLMAVIPEVKRCVETILTGKVVPKN